MADGTYESTPGFSAADGPVDEPAAVNVSIVEKVTDGPPSNARGIHTTEFLLTTVVVLALLALVGLGKVDFEAVSGTLGIILAGYGISRGIAKH